MRDALSAGYRFSDLRNDLLAGIVVGVVALPLAMALAIASGVPPVNGLYTAIIGGAVIALAGGSHVQVSGPTAAFVVILAPIAQQHGLGGLLLATLLAGIMLVLLGAAGMGKLIEFIPYPVTTGFTAGIAVVIATLQLRDFFGLSVEHMPNDYLERVHVLAGAAGTWQLSDTLIGALTLALLIVLPKLTRKVPAPIIALPVAAVAGWLMTRYLPGTSLNTIQSRFGGIPQTLPSPLVPWLLRDPAGDFLEVRQLLGPAFAIAMLGAIESLLSAVIADGMTGRRHNPDSELIAQGLGNIASPFFGGIAATGAIARTATNIRSGARSPLSAFFHAIFILAAMLLMAPLLGYLPMAALAALLLVVAWNMSEVRHVIRTVRVAPRSDIMVLLTCFGLTVVFDMVIAVGAGVVLAALMLIRRVADLATVRFATEEHPTLAEPLPQGTMLYEIGGPLFFGAAQKAVSALRTVSRDVKVLILDMRGVPSMDATGLVNLESALDALHAAGIFVVIAGVQDQPLHLMARAGWKHRPWLVVWRNFEEAITLVRSLAPSDLISMHEVHPHRAAGPATAATH
ncbi:MAG: C4-dicarboxylic acid transporter DauA [Phycisphaerae bacterium]|nr:C4-dicarboxylic acid transporter DauA [Phycisphaerae bacterium]